MTSVDAFVIIAALCAFPFFRYVVPFLWAKFWHGVADAVNTYRDPWKLDKDLFSDRRNGIMSGSQLFEISERSHRNEDKINDLMLRIEKLERNHDPT